MKRWAVIRLNGKPEGDLDAYRIIEVYYMFDHISDPSVIEVFESRTAAELFLSTLRMRTLSL